MTYDYGQGDGTLSLGAERVLAAMADFTTISTRLSDQIAAGQHQWVGSGGEAFRRLAAAWSEKQGVIVRVLDGFADSLRATENLNLAQDDEVRDSALRLASRLG